MKNIHILPTDKLSSLRIGDNGNFVFGLMQSAIVSKNDFYTNQHIYITSDEEIKEGDYFWKPDCNMIFKAEYTPHKGCQKVILTTDQDLIKDGVQAIDDEFLEWFVKNPSCERVEIKEKQHFEADKSKRKNPLNGVYYSYKIIIPKEEPTEEAKQRAKNYMSLKGALEPKQETLEEAAENYTKDGTKHFVEKTNVQLGFIEGAKWQQERMYSEKDMKEAIQETITLMRYKATEFREHENTVIEQFKKK